MRTRSLAVAAAALVLLVSGCGDDESDSAEDPGTGGSISCDYPDSPSTVETKEVDPPPATTDGADVAGTIALGAGDVPIELDGADAPCTVNSFISLAEQGYYDDTTCHRLTGGGSLNVLQCGDPSATGAGGPGYSFADELDALPAPDADTTIAYPAGTLAMANAGPDTNGSQFFIVYADSRLPPAYTIFGTVDQSGIDVVAGIAQAGTDNGTGDGAPANPVTVDSVSIDD